MKRDERSWSFVLGSSTNNAVFEDEDEDEDDESRTSNIQSRHLERCPPKADPPPAETQNMELRMNTKDREILRDLAKRVVEIADSPEMAERRRRWVEHNTLRSTYPMLLVFPEGAWCELLTDDAIKCSDKRARGFEYNLRARIYAFEHFRDDMVVEKEWVVSKRIKDTGWGLDPLWIPSPTARGARHFDPVIKEPSDLKKLRYPEVSYDEAGTMEDMKEIEDLFGGILTIPFRGVTHLSYHIMSQYTSLRGLEEVMMDMYAEPRMLHDAMAFFEEGHHRILRQYVDMNLLSFNNDLTYHNSGGNGYSDELPLPDADPARVRPKDMWASAEAQEMAQVSPEHHDEFVLQYEKRLLAPFGLLGYGCCEDLTRKLDRVLTIPRMRRISISPWSNVDSCAEQLKGKCIFSWKPNPAHLVGHFDEAAVREYVRHTVTAARANGCVLEMILKDTHTCEHQTERFDEWTRIAREVILEEWGETAGQRDNGTTGLPFDSAQGKQDH